MPGYQNFGEICFGEQLCLWRHCLELTYFRICTCPKSLVLVLPSGTLVEPVCLSLCSFFRRGPYRARQFLKFPMIGVVCRKVRLLNLVLSVCVARDSGNNSI